MTMVMPAGLEKTKQEMEERATNGKEKGYDYHGFTHW